MQFSHLTVMGMALALAIASAVPEVDAGKQCADKCWQQVNANNNAPPAKRKLGCKALFAATVVPCPVTNTKTVTTTSTSTTGKTITTTLIRGQPTTITQTSTGTTTITSYSTTIETITFASAVKLAATNKRELDHNANKSCQPKTVSTTAVPTYFAACSNLAAYSSACSCLKAPHTTITSSQQPITTTVTQTVTTNTEKDVTVTVTSDAPTATITTTTMTTVVERAGATTSTCTAPAALATVGTADSSVTAGSGPQEVEYRWQEQKNGFIVDSNNPGTDPNYPPKTNYYDASLDINSAASKCAAAAHAVSPNPNNPSSLGYASFDLHFLCSVGAWVCVQYPNLNTDASSYDQSNQDSVVGVLYSFNH